MRTLKQLVLTVVVLWMAVHLIWSDLGGLSQRRQQAAESRQRLQVYEAFPDRERWGRVGRTHTDFDGYSFRWTDIDDDSVTVERSTPSGETILVQEQLSKIGGDDSWFWLGPKSYVLIGDYRNGGVFYKVVHQRHHTF